VPSVWIRRRVACKLVKSGHFAWGIPRAREMIQAMTRSTLAATAAATALAASAGAAVTGLQVEYNGLVGGRHVWSVYAVSDDPNHVMLNVFGHTVVAGSMSGVQHSDFGGGTWSPNFTILPDQAAIDSFVTVSGLSGADASTNLDSGFSGGGAGFLERDSGILGCHRHADSN
jgi:hypothetical protein